jgi:hypothetical protein
VFCVGIHQGTTSLLVGADFVAPLDNWRHEGFDPRINSTFELLEKLTLAPEEVTAKRYRAATGSRSVG